MITFLKCLISAIIVLNSKFTYDLINVEREIKHCTTDRLKVKHKTCFESCYKTGDNPTNFESLYKESVCFSDCLNNYEQDSLKLCEHNVKTNLD